MKFILAVISLSIASIAIAQEPLTNDASFPGGYEKLSEFINTELKWDEIEQWAKENKLPMKNTVYVLFVVEKSGALSKMRIQGTTVPCPPCEKEAIRVMQQMPIWEPARKNGRAVRFWVRLPFVFDMESEN